MEIFNINIRLEDLQLNKNLKGTMKKVLKVIKSMERPEHIEVTRRYVDLWYRAFGDTHKTIIELYFKSKSNEIR
jgi:hypothetical protein|tara:strand:- start:922 stop:1143 length:222 start_codon:yes stop_codon:yes gene_type:complete